MATTTPSLVHTSRLLTDTRVRVTCRTRRCTCGCSGRDPWHREAASRTLRGVRVLGAPRPYPLRDGGVCTVRHVVAVADVLAPWGEVVHAQAVAYTEGAFAWWELVGLV